MNSKWDYQTIGDVCTVERGGSPRPIDDYITESDDGINWIKIGDTDDSMYITKTAQKIRPEGMKKSRYVQPGDFLLSNSMSFGRPYILKIDGCIHDGWLVLRDNNNLFDKRFLYYLSSKTTYQRFKAMAVGGVVNNLNSEMVRKVSVPIPRMHEQSEIADLLDGINSVIQERNRELELLDELIKARFVELFGTLDRPSQEFKWDTLENLCNKITDGKHGGCTQEDGTGRFFVGAREIYDDKVHYDTAPQISVSDFEKDYKRCNVEKGDFLIVNTGATIGKSAIASDERTPYTLLQKSVALLKVKDDCLHPVFLKYCYIVNDRMYRVESASAQPNLLLSKINKTCIYVPTMKLQLEFVDFVAQSDKSKSAVQKSLDETQLLFNSLMQEYFG